MDIQNKVSAHTAGPWNRGRISTNQIVGENGHAVCSVNEFLKEFEANARLIATAPDLLEACKACLYALRPEAEDMGIDAAANRAVAWKHLGTVIAKASASPKE